MYELDLLLKCLNSSVLSDETKVEIIRYIGDIYAM